VNAKRERKEMKLYVCLYRSLFSFSLSLSVIVERKDKKQKKKKTEGRNNRRQLEQMSR
jgi:hypothetical protein